MGQVLSCQILILIYLDDWNFHPSKFSILKPHKFNNLLRIFIWVDYQSSCSFSFGGNSEYIWAYQLNLILYGCQMFKGYYAYSDQ
jgi:hypothetical protein